MIEHINKTMDRDDLFLHEDAAKLIKELNLLIRSFQNLNLHLSGWHGTLTDVPANPEKDSRNCGTPGGYIPIPGAADDPHFPWFLYWEIFWALKHTLLKDGWWILDAGGACSLFWAYLSELRNYKVFSCELDEKLVEQAQRIAQIKTWLSNDPQTPHWSSSIVQDITKLEIFPPGSFDAIFSICVMEHLTIHQRQRAIREYHRTLVPGGTLTITFDYKNPRPAIFRPDPQDPFEWKDQLMSTPEDLRKCFLLDEGLFEIQYNQELYDNGKTYLGHPRYNYAPYTFGALFLKKR